jgi:hypothetical protein
VSGTYRVIVTDTSPLFALVLADALEVLLRPGLPISIPDAVYIEAARVRGAPGADRIVEWINDRLDMVRTPRYGAHRSDGYRYRSAAPP